MRRSLTRMTLLLFRQWPKTDREPKRRRHGLSTVAKYLRLSNEDLAKPDAGESVSIINQRHILDNYLDTHPAFDGWNRVELCDDGWSGTNFDRPGMKELLELVRKGSVQCIIVKDLSRFGRDYLAAGYYITRVFPSLRVRFISLGDGYDSARPEDLDSLNVSFSTLVYDLYSRELSRKVRDAKDRLAKRGDFLAPAAPFGYVKDPARAKHLIVDPGAGKTVRFIFDMVCEGKATREIAQLLNKHSVPTPMSYKRGQGKPRLPRALRAEDSFWTASMVAKIIRDERYTGCTVYGKRRRDLSGNRTVKASRDQWIITKGTHEALVSNDRFLEAQSQLRENRKRKSTGAAAPLAGRVCCGCCGRAMARSPGRTNHYFCKTQRFTDRFACSEDTISEQDVIDVIMESIRVQIRLVGDPDALAVQERGQKEKAWNRLRQTHASIQSRKKQTEQGLRTLYERYVEGIISKGEYLTQKRALSQLLGELAESMQQLKADISKSNGTEVIGWNALDALAKENVRRLIDRITIYPGKTLDVCLSFSDIPRIPGECVRIDQGTNRAE